MKILLVADGRSPITRNWIEMLQDDGINVSLVSTYSCTPIPAVEQLATLPVAFGNLAGSQLNTGGYVKNRNHAIHKAVGSLRNVLVNTRYSVGLWTIKGFQKKLMQIVAREKPALVHALRIPFEGMLASCTPTAIPLIVSIWGNDLTLHAHRNKLCMNWTKRTLMRVNGLMADTQRDIRLAREMGLGANKPTLIVPGGGGVDLTAIQKQHEIRAELDALIPKGKVLVINPRGFRPGSVRNDIFFKAAAQIIQERQDVHFLCAAMTGQKEAVDWVRKLNIENNMHLLPYLKQEQLWALFQRCLISVSVSEHDGTPNSLLEAMAIGCLPICGNIESIREWITDGENGLLVKPGDPEELHTAILHGLNDGNLREAAKQKNQQIIRQRAEKILVRKAVMGYLSSFN